MYGIQNKYMNLVMVDLHNRRFTLLLAEICRSAIYNIFQKIHNNNFMWVWFSIRTDSICKTPDNRDGDCTILQQCDPLFRLSLIGPTTEQQTFLRNSQCGRDGENVFVCCSNKFMISNSRDANISDGLAGNIFNSLC